MELESNRVFVTLEKVTQTQIDIVYYAKLKIKKLYRIRLEDGQTPSIKERKNQMVLQMQR